MVLNFNYIPNVPSLFLSEAVKLGFEPTFLQFTISDFDPEEKKSHYRSAKL